MLSPALRSFHDKVYVLTTPAAADRHQNCIDQLGEGNFEFVYSLDKNTVTIDELIRDGVYDDEAAIRVDRWDRSMTLGHICCAFGHRKIYQQLLESGHERVLVFEDDVVDLDVPEDEIAAAIAAVPEDGDIIYWGWSHGKLWSVFGELQNWVFHVRRAFGSYRYTHRQIRNLYMRPYNDHFDVSAGNYLLHSYSITRRGARVLIDANTPITRDADNVPIWSILNRDMKGYVTRKQFFGQRSRDPKDPMESSTEILSPAT